MWAVAPRHERTPAPTGPVLQRPVRRALALHALMQGATSQPTPLTKCSSHSSQELIHHPPPLDPTHEPWQRQPCFVWAGRGGASCVIWVGWDDQECVPADSDGGRLCCSAGGGDGSSAAAGPLGLFLKGWLRAGWLGMIPGEAGKQGLQQQDCTSSLLAKSHLPSAKISERCIYPEFLL